MTAAALAVLRDQGYANATARSVAAAGGFNAALIFYHFGSLDELFLAAVEHSSRDRLARYQTSLAEVSTLADLLARLRELYAEEADIAHVAAVQQLVAVSAFSPEMATRLESMMEPWMTFVGALMRRLLDGTLIAEALDGDDTAFGLVAVYMGLETMTRLAGGDRQRLDRLFDQVARLVSSLEPMLRAASTRGRKRPAAARIVLE